jgi:hypothetical protein
MTNDLLSNLVLLDRIELPYPRYKGGVIPLYEKSELVEMPGFEPRTRTFTELEL